MKTKLPAIALSSLLLAATALTWAAPPTLSELKKEVRAGANSAGWHDTIVPQLWNGGSCVDASESRARTIAAHLKKLRDAGKFGDYQATVGTQFGYDGGYGSLHTFTVVEIKDRRGRPIAIWEVDNYLGPTIISNVDAIDWTQSQMTAISKVKSRPKPPAPATTIRNLPKPPRHPVGGSSGPGKPHAHHH